MDTLRLPTTTPAELRSAIEQAVEILRSGEPVALPTETVYGLAADALNTHAVSRIFESKERPLFDPLIVHLPDREWLQRLTAIPSADVPLVNALIARFWPGPLTLVLPRTDRVPDLVASGLPTVAVRMSAHPVFCAVAEAFGGPLAAPSANRFGRISPTTADHVWDELNNRIPLVIDGGPTQHGVESTIVLIENGSLSILRAGPITPDQLAEFAPVLTVIPGKKPTAPGQLKSHYAPRTPLTLLRAGEPPEAATNTGLLAWSAIGDPKTFGHVEILSVHADLTEAAATLFAKLRRLDSSGVARIVAEPVPEKGLGIAIMDRLRKAAARG